MDVCPQIRSLFASIYSWCIEHCLPGEVTLMHHHFGSQLVNAWATCVNWNEVGDSMLVFFQFIVFFFFATWKAYFSVLLLWFLEAERETTNIFATGGSDCVGDKEKKQKYQVFTRAPQMKYNDSPGAAHILINRSLSILFELNTERTP